MSTPENKYITMSTRLSYILRKLGIEYLGQLSGFSEERLFNAKNYGRATHAELMKICRENGIAISGKGASGMWLLENREDKKINE